MMTLSPFGSQLAFLMGAGVSISISQGMLTALRLKMRSRFSLPPVSSLSSSGENSTVLTTCLWSNWCSSSPFTASQSRAEKSPPPVATRLASELKAALHTAPLCPSKVPIQSPLSPQRSIGFLSWQPLTKKVPSSVSRLKRTSTTGRKCPGHTMGNLRCSGSQGVVEGDGDSSEAVEATEPDDFSARGAEEDMFDCLERFYCRP
mmetsp:Transcript_14914/g.28966  ORF Transcript_14914/g.28966 Transcript_14914/m.28966 type:complete len:204 (+) Transcript_14914:1427-2038(+)